MMQGQRDFPSNRRDGDNLAEIRMGTIPAIHGLKVLPRLEPP